jgi:hypothetical protein
LDKFRTLLKSSTLHNASVKLRNIHLRRTREAIGDQSGHSFMGEVRGGAILGQVEEEVG